MKSYKKTESEPAWERGTIDDVYIKDVKIFKDKRGWLAEVFRLDELDKNLHPAMCYFSATAPDIVRGPHEHKEQTDYFAFLFGKVKVVLWDNRPSSKDYGKRMEREFGSENPTVMTVPPGVVHF